jgi:hypothetical protein
LRICYKKWHFPGDRKASFARGYDKAGNFFYSQRMEEELGIEEVK